MLTFLRTSSWNLFEKLSQYTITSPAYSSTKAAIVNVLLMVIAIRAYILKELSHFKELTQQILARYDSNHFSRFSAPSNLCDIEHSMIQFFF